MKLALALLALLSALPAFAADNVIVEGVQSPAWVERDGRRSPLAPGMQLDNRDRVVSGRNARVLLRMPEGSLVKLGEDARLGLDQIETRREAQKNVVTATLDVLQGAFRFTTQAATRFRGERRIDVRIATVTAGIRGTDLWGKAAFDRDIVCLIEGDISVQKQGDAPFRMNEPLSFYIAPRNAAPLPVQPVPKEQLEAWATETEIPPGQGAVRRDGRWVVTLAEVAEQRDALLVYDGAREAGFPAQIRPVVADGKTTYRVRIVGLPGEADAQALAQRVRGLPGVGAPVVSR